MSSLITGGTGFIGAELARLLLKRGETKPVVLDLSSSTQRLDDIADRVNLVRGDVGDFSDVLNTVKVFKPDVIYHLGGMLSLPSEAHPQAAMRANVLGTFHVLEAARLFGVRQCFSRARLGPMVWISTGTLSMIIHCNDRTYSMGPLKYLANIWGASTNESMGSISAGFGTRSSSGLASKRLPLSNTRHG